MSIDYSKLLRNTALITPITFDSNGNVDGTTYVDNFILNARVMADMCNINVTFDASSKWIYHFIIDVKELRCPTRIEPVMFFSDMSISYKIEGNLLTIVNLSIYPSQTSLITERMRIVTDIANIHKHHVVVNVINVTCNRLVSFWYTENIWQQKCSAIVSNIHKNVSNERMILYADHVFVSDVDLTNAIALKCRTDGKGLECLEPLSVVTVQCSEFDVQRFIGNSIIKTAIDSEVVCSVLRRAILNV